METKELMKLYEGLLSRNLFQKAPGLDPHPMTGGWQWQNNEAQRGGIDDSERIYGGKKSGKEVTEVRLEWYIGGLSLSDYCWNRMNRDGPSLNPGWWEPETTRLKLILNVHKTQGSNLILFFCASIILSSLSNNLHKISMKQSKLLQCNVCHGDDQFLKVITQLSTLNATVPTFD